MQAELVQIFQAFGNRFVYPFCYFLPGACQLAVNWLVQREFIDFFTLSPDFDVVGPLHVRFNQYIPA